MHKKYLRKNELKIQEWKPEGVWKLSRLAVSFSGVWFCCCFLPLTTRVANYQLRNNKRSGKEKISKIERKKLKTKKQSSLSLSRELHQKFIHALSCPASIYNCNKIHFYVISSECWPFPSPLSPGFPPALPSSFRCIFSFCSVSSQP